jgi:hypothetical protein
MAQEVSGLWVRPRMVGGPGGLVVLSVASGGMTSGGPGKCWGRDGL